MGYFVVGAVGMKGRAIVNGARHRGGGRRAWLPYVLIAPAFLVIGPFAIFPFFYSIYLSLFEFSVGGSEFLGLEHYRSAIGNSDFWASVTVTGYYAVGTVLPALGLSLLIALGLYRIQRFRTILRTAYFLPFVTSIVAAAMVWRSLLEPTTGPLTQMMLAVGLEPEQWLLEPRGILHIMSGGRVDVSVGPSLALCCVMLFEIWRSIGFMVVIFLAALTGRDRTLEEAASLDGASSRQVVWHVVLPTLSPVIFFLGVVSVIQSFQAFSGFYALTGNGRGPVDTTQNLTVYIYTSFYEYGRIGYGSAIATMLSIAIMLFTLVQWRLMQRRVTYGS